jgi:aspartate racemase
VPVVVWNVAQIPDRQKALIGSGESPVPALLEGLRRLLDAGATRIAMPCNTAHYWFDDLAAQSPVPFFHIVDTAISLLKKNFPESATGPVGVLATRGTLASGLYQARLQMEGFQCVCNTDEEIDTFFVPGCYSVKRNAVEAGGRLLERAADALAGRGATRLILACTEVPLALESIRSRHLACSIDTNLALAKACVDYWMNLTKK